ncbi:MAG TPA: TadE/TadG family type IV pilus assembly protein [Terriglobales bacterium]|nr:TadE/TadG family type IV pilus assembly protein [Terriglobales bacterium]
MNRRQQRGAVLVEAAIGLLLFFTLVLGILDFSRAFNVYQTISNAAREGARYSVAPDPGTTTLPTVDQVVAHTQGFLDASSVAGSTIQVNQTFAGAADLVYTDVTISVPYTSFLIGGTSFTISADSRMRNETN